MEIQINLSLRRLKLLRQQSVIGVYPVAIGKPQTPTPEGYYRITRKVINPGGILGSRWLELSIPSYDGPYGIHGTTQPWSIGKAVSNGCIRMYNRDVEEVFRHVRVGTPVNIFSYGGTKYQNHGKYYTVKPGDTLWGISRRFGVPVDLLLKLNKEVDPHRLRPGQKLALG